MSFGLSSEGLPEPKLGVQLLTLVSLANLSALFLSWFPFVEVSSKDLSTFRSNELKGLKPLVTKKGERRVDLEGYPLIATSASINYSS